MTDRFNRQRIGSVKSLFILTSFIFVGCTNSEGTKPFSNKDKENQMESDTGEVEGYIPSNPIPFSHSLHSEIDCKYCHNQVDQSNKKELPSISVCTNCHDLKKGQRLNENTTPHSKPECSYDSNKDYTSNRDKLESENDCSNCHY